jgi:nicotinate dehydrogenase subunit B
MSPSLDKASAIGAWLELDAGAERVVVKSGKVEIGQRITRALRAIVCAELQLAPRQVTALPVSTRYSPDEGYTAGSNSIEHSGLALRLTCRSLLTLMQKRAARRFNVEPGDVTFANGEFSATTSDETLTLWDLFDADIADAAIAETGNFSDDNQHALRALQGSARLNVSPVNAHPDDAAQFDGTLQFVHDLACDLHARVVRPPHPGGRLGAIAEAPIRAAIVPLILVVDGSFVAVAGDDEWRVIKAAERLAQQLPWQRQYELPAGDVTASLCDYPRDSLAVVAGTPDPDAGSAALEPLSENYDLDALFTRPYQMHGSIGPSAALAKWSDAQLDIVSHTQGVFPLRSAIAEAIGLPPARVHITHAPGAGCYGHNGADDAAFDAALVARALPGRTVLLKWSRADEHRYEPYASAMAVRIRATVAADGMVKIWEHDSYSDTHVARPRAGLGEAGRSRLLAAHYTTDPAPRFRAQANLNRHGGIHRNADPIYDFAQSRIAKHLVHHLPLRVSAMRTLGAFKCP